MPENSSYLTRSIPLVSPFGPTFGGSISRLPPRSIVVKKILPVMDLCRVVSEIQNSQKLNRVGPFSLNPADSQKSFRLFGRPIQMVIFL